MITEQMLQQAAAQLSDAMVKSVADIPHDFSPRFLRRMQPLFRRAQHPVRYRLVRQCAAVLLALITVFGALLALSPTVRAAVFGWIRTIVGKNIEYSSQETTPPNVHYDYSLPEILDGYTLLELIEDGAGEKTYIYVSKTGQLMQFGYMRGSTSSSLILFDPKDYTRLNDIVNGCSAEIYIAPNPTTNSIIIWTDTENNVLLFINANVTKEELVALAEKVEKKIIF